MAAGLTTVNYLMFYYSRTGNLDVPAFFWSAIGLAILANVLTNGLTTRRAVWLGVFAALGVATKDQSVALFLPVCLVLLLPRFNQASGRPRWLAPLVVGLLVAIGVYLAATGMLVDPRRHMTHVYSLLFNPSRLSAGGAYFTPTPHSWLGFLQMAWTFGSGLAAMMSPPVLLTAAVGCALVLRDNRWHAIWLMPFATIFGLLIWLPGHMILRYLLPLTLFVDAFAAVALVRLRASRFRAAFVPLVILLVGTRLAMGIDLSYAQWRDTRYAAADWFRSNARAGDRIEYFGVAETLPALGPELISRRVMGRTQWIREAGHGPGMLDYLIREGPKYVIVVPDWTSLPALEHSGDCPPEVYAALLDGSAGYTLAAHITTPALLPRFLRRPRLDYAMVAPPVRIFLRKTAP